MRLFIRFPEPKIDAWELFDLKSDPNEMESAYGHPGKAEIQKTLKRELSRLREQFKVDAK